MNCAATRGERRGYSEGYFLSFRLLELFVLEAYCIGQEVTEYITYERQRAGREI